MKQRRFRHFGRNDIEKKELAIVFTQPHNLGTMKTYRSDIVILRFIRRIQEHRQS
jgi:hypothetical protein